MNDNGSKKTTTRNRTKTTRKQLLRSPPKHLSFGLIWLLNPKLVKFPNYAIHQTFATHWLTDILVIISLLVLDLCSVYISRISHFKSISKFS